MAVPSLNVKIENICRTCLSKEMELLSVFETYMGKITLQNVITSVTGIEFAEGDGLPTTICCECRNKATTAYDFKSRSREADMALQGLIKKEKDGQAISENQNPEADVDVKIENAVDNVDHYMDLDFNLSPNNINENFDEDDLKCISESPLDLDDKVSLNELRVDKKVTDSKLKNDSGECKNENETHKSYCPLCSTSYSDAEILTKHMWHSHADLMGPKKRGRPRKMQINTILRKLSENGYSISTCTFCKTDFKTKKELDVHMDLHKDTVIINCLKCKKLYSSKINFKQHKCQSNFIEKTQNSVPPDVTEQDGNMSSEVLLKEAIVSDKGSAGLVSVKMCEVCGRIFPSLDDMSKHRDDEHPELSVRCRLCNKVFASVKSAERHRVSCKRLEREYTCATCGQGFAFEISLNKHILRNHAGQRVSVGFMDRQKDRFACEMCDRTFSRKGQLVRHSVVHKTVIKYECDLCKKKFNRKSNLKAHIYRVHESERSEKSSKAGLCLYCGRSFNNSSNLIVHMRRHTGEKPYQCDFCGKGFPRSSDLQCHRRSHTGEKPCKCGVCGKGFSRSNKLSRHMRVHTGDRPYKCTYCDKAFSQSNDLTLHVRRHTGDKPYVCEICGDRFIQGTALQNHRRAQGHYLQAPQPQLTYTVQNITQTH